MNPTQRGFWDERYSDEEFAYGTEPNCFFSDQINQLKAGSIILPCDGEGRNGVYAAVLGWKVNAFDSSEEARKKAMKLAKEKHTELDYQVGDAQQMVYPSSTADVVALIFAHLTDYVRRTLHQRAINWLKPGGVLILEAFNPKQLHNLSGGPKDISMLYTKEKLTTDFMNLDTELLDTTELILSEGKYHEGKADVIRYIGRKKT